MELRNCIAILTLSLFAGAQNESGFEKALRTTAEQLDPAVLPVVWITTSPGANWPVLGSAFLINHDGYFVTANHVLDSHPLDPQGHLAVMVRQMSGDAGAHEFQVVDKDTRHDLALCRIELFDDEYWKHRSARGTKPKDEHFAFAFTTLSLAAHPPELGETVLMAGFPLGSWNPTMQFGHVAALGITNPLTSGTGPYFQVSAAGNQGDSGGPIVDLHSGEVIGIVVRSSFTSTQSTLQSSGIMLAKPASLIAELLKKHRVIASREHWIFDVSRFPKTTK